MLDRIHKTAKAIINTDGLGNFSPEKTDLIIYSVVVERFNELLLETVRAANKENRGLAGVGKENNHATIQEKIDHYLEINQEMNYSNELFSIDKDVFRVDSLLYRGTKIELVSGMDMFNLVCKTATIDYPIALQSGKQYMVCPKDITDGVKISYLRRPIQNKWTYMSVGNTVLFNPGASDFKDIDIHPTEEYEVLLRTLEKLGIKLKEDEVQKTLERHKAQDFNEKNIS